MLLPRARKILPVPNAVVASTKASASESSTPRVKALVPSVRARPMDTSVSVALVLVRIREAVDPEPKISKRASGVVSPMPTLPVSPSMTKVLEAPAESMVRVVLAISIVVEAVKDILAVEITKSPEGAKVRFPANVLMVEAAPKVRAAVGAEVPIPTLPSSSIINKSPSAAAAEDMER